MNKMHTLTATGTGLAVLLIAGCLSVKLPNVTLSNPSEGQQAMTWNRAMLAALEHHPDLIEARAEVKSKARGRDSAAGDFLPSVDGIIQHNVARTTGTGPTKDTQAFKISGSQPLFAGFQIYADFLSAKRDLESEEYSYLDTSASVRFDLRSVYVELLKLEKLVEVNRRIAERRRQNADLIQHRYEAGREHLGSTLRAQAIASQADFSVRQTLRRIDSQSVLLQRELGGDFNESFRPGEDMETLVPKPSDTRPDLPALALETPSVNKLLKTAESYKAAVLSSQSAVWPQVDGTYDYNYTGGKTSTLRDSATLGLKVTVPFFKGGKNVQAIRQAREDYKAAWEAAKSERDQKIADLADAWAAYQDAVELVEVRRQFQNAARERAEIVRSQYTTGLVNFQDFDIAEQDLADSETAYVQSLANALTAQAKWELTKGSTLEEGLNES